MLILASFNFRSKKDVFSIYMKSNWHLKLNYGNFVILVSDLIFDLFLIALIDG